MIKLSNQQIIEALTPGTIIAAILNERWHQLPAELVSVGGEGGVVDHYVDPDDIFTEFRSGITSPDLLQILNDLQNA